MSMQPNTIDVKPEKLTIEWSDGKTCIYSARYLRSLCQCAHCVHEITGEKILNEATILDNIQIQSAEPTGHYGLTFGFTDSHATGIYAYDFLRKNSKE